MPPTLQEQEEQVRKILEMLRPYLQADGGDCEFGYIEDNIAYIHLKGACVGCASALMTLKMGIERRIVEEVPGIESVEAI
ncbi:NifU family protein [Candidatus Poribacteria bacterium]|nr:NifU family protein [Candidatus Poribacteria bacterium]